MIRIHSLKDHPHTIPRLAQIWHEVLGKKWLPEVPVEKIIQNLQGELNLLNNIDDNSSQIDKSILTDQPDYDSLPITLVALYNNIPVGMCSLRVNDGIREDLTPWLSSLVVDPEYQSKGIGRLLIENIKAEARILNYKKLYLFAFDPELYKYYQKFDFKIIGMDEFKNHQVTVMESYL